MSLIDKTLLLTPEYTLRCDATVKLQMKYPRLRAWYGVLSVSDPEQHFTLHTKVSFPYTGKSSKYEKRKHYAAVYCVLETDTEGKRGVMKWKDKEGKFHQASVKAPRGWSFAEHKGNAVLRLNKDPELGVYHDLNSLYVTSYGRQTVRSELVKVRRVAEQARKDRRMTDARLKKHKREEAIRVAAEEKDLIARGLLGCFVLTDKTASRWVFRHEMPPESYRQLRGLYGDEPWDLFSMIEKDCRKKPKSKAAAKRREYALRTLRVAAAVAQKELANRGNT